MNSNRTRLALRFTGWVQGVGFRATARSVAEGFAVAGWVRNEPDGSVRCVVEGERGEIDRFVEALRARMARHIRDVETEEQPATGEFERFEIRR